ncbi:tyrosine-protein phosphatase [Geomesophilobacter sediminis]|uniref:protein-tyrosine-phosphatase n=1 Tax=Geomesophilobacter sediminis TaxID=2798584 RepID=A0A8J7M069_9BACT|nr:CpsB/CapC family capsule biosynthesis tyrosine phosphatase [Geomesophilobacter sediminis]MBJ6723627.1 phosphoesterase [Geomesophilobacter sediminis]
MKEYVDFHCHILPALDDGAVDLADSLAIARALSDFGFTTVHCTSHLIAESYCNLPARVTQTTESLQTRLSESGISLRLVPGSEHHLNAGLFDYLDAPLTVGGSRWILVEAPFRSDAASIRTLIPLLQERGLQPLIAHPERCSVFNPPPRRKSFFFRGPKGVPDPGLFQELRAAGCRFQGNLGSFAGWYGPQVRQRALEILAEGGYSCLGSDAHQPEGLAEMLQQGYAVLAGAIGASAADALLRGELLQLS